MCERITLIGHIFHPSGRGEDIRSFTHSLDFVGTDVKVIDILKGYKDDNRFVNKVAQERSKINIFFINADEISYTLDHTGALNKNHLNIVFPAWELSNYPDEWAQRINLFDAVFCSSEFTLDSIKKSTSIPIFYQSFPIVPRLSSLLTRSDLGLPDDCFLFFSALDTQSYIHRKNPFATILAFDKFYEHNKSKMAKLVLKIKTGKNSFLPDNKKNLLLEIPEIQQNLELTKIVKKHSKNIILINNLLSENENNNLIRLCDVILSLHRSEGFGRLLAEGMYFGKPVIGTSYSGNMDFMTNDNSCLIDFKLIDVREGQYPFYENQQWADANIEQAGLIMSKLVNDKVFYDKVAKKGNKTMLLDYSYNMAGLNMLENINKAKISKNNKVKK